MNITSRRVCCANQGHGEASRTSGSIRQPNQGPSNTCLNRAPPMYADPLQNHKLKALESRAIDLVPPVAPVSSALIRSKVIF